MTEGLFALCFHFYHNRFAVIFLLAEKLKIEGSLREGDVAAGD